MIAQARDIVAGATVEFAILVVARDRQQAPTRADAKDLEAEAVEKLEEIDEHGSGIHVAGAELEGDAAKTGPCHYVFGPAQRRQFVPLDVHLQEVDEIEGTSIFDRFRGHAAPRVA